MISGFSGRYRWLSNFWPCQIVSKTGLHFNSVEAAYQAAKCADPESMQQFTTLTALEAKRRGKTIRMRQDWDKIKVEVMRRLLVQKFPDLEFTASDDPHYEISMTPLSNQLLETHPHVLVEYNTWGDKFWGCTNKDGTGGQNWLGLLLMDRRAKLVRDIDSYERQRKAAPQH
jgi:ribA/ribD-fused uncharacterized protein